MGSHSLFAKQVPTDKKPFPTKPKTLGVTKQLRNLKACVMYIQRCTNKSLYNACLPIDSETVNVERV